ncbi:MAG TPA: hypothetical protein VNO52_02455 [Methylomirabilota bacterium]|nr:hypothetical protein [Methylomirabilota bacterium]
MITPIIFATGFALALVFAALMLRDSLSDRSILGRRAPLAATPARAGFLDLVSSMGAAAGLIIAVAWVLR